MKTKLLILFLLVFITIVFLLTPYKFYTAAWPIIMSNCSSNIAEELTCLFDGNLLGIPFVFIFLPLVLFSEIFFSNNLSSKKWRIIFIIQGAVGILATYAMYWLMTFQLVEADVRLTPVFYISLLFMTVSSIGSILLSIGKVNGLIIGRIRNSDLQTARDGTQD